MRLDTILQYKMTGVEADAYKLCLIWEAESKRLFPEQYLARIPSSGDPRKSHLFRHCWKMLRETRGILSEADRKLYVIANLVGVKVHNGRIDPNILSGDQAWKRWKTYKWLYERKLAEKNGEAPNPNPATTSPKLIWELEMTKKFLHEKCDGEVTETKIKEFIDSGTLKFWTLRGKVSPFYIVQSPFLQKHANIQQLGEQCWFNPSLIKSKVSDDVAAYFRQEFSYEFTA